MHAQRTSVDDGRLFDSRWLRRRVSNPSLRVVGAGPSQDNGEVTADEVAPRETGLHQTAPNEVKSACDLGFALMVAAAVGSDS